MGLDSPRPAHLYQNRKFPSNLSSITCGGVLGGAGVAFLSSTCEYRRGSEMIANRFPKWVPKALASRGSPENLFFIKNIFNMREQEWQSACLASMWPGIEFVFGLFLVLYLAPRGFSPGTPVSPILKNQLFQIPIWSETHGQVSTSSHELLSAKCFLCVNKVCLFLCLYLSKFQVLSFLFFHIHMWQEVT